ncbi:Polyphosphoinositide phosphatase [Strongyloides ratti]|uniref:Polyphosphoinositide phosphatase n=1 Tax=Strongyloides ratti TaxID=34506 RepID=A0A090LTG6_STRRB|nr:Polyphosphoinositide phosphatase [Strongyloides ratti]CEF71517.1 Polyphosphoinositide phosphatase [Strongyloides ratti]
MSYSNHVYKISIFETLANFYFIGKDRTGQKYSVLKIDRTHSYDLTIGEPEHNYTQKEVEELLATISGSSIIVKGSLSLMGIGNGSRKGLNEVVGKSYGIIGAVKFLEGYYIIVITAARPVSYIGYHVIYKIEETQMIYLPFNKTTNYDEQRYLKLFQLIDLSTNFYFSYTYDLSKTLQENILHNNINMQKESQFFWNNYLLKPLRDSGVDEKWLVNIMHGYIGHQVIDMPLSKNMISFVKFSITLIGRRSSYYAGTRFLKRGANYKGHCANNIETEQIVWEMTSSSNFYYGNFSSFVQRRSSVPLIWSQDPSTRGVVGKPSIQLNINEPNSKTAAIHFSELATKYGCPIVVMNLVKRNVKNAKEKILHTEFLKSVNNLNQFLPKKNKIAYLSFDIAHYHKTKTSVLFKLEEIGYRILNAQGWFQTKPSSFLIKNPKKYFLENFKPLLTENDRTNVAQFGMAKVALGCQLYSMGLIDEPIISFSSELCKNFEEMFDEHGDTMALQYAGSQLVHTIKTYKKISAFQEKSRDVIQTLSRYYSNTFGYYIPHEMKNIYPPIWDISSDFMLHFTNDDKKKGGIFDVCKWFESITIKKTNIDNYSIENYNLFDDYYNCQKTTFFKDKFISIVPIKTQNLEHLKQEQLQSSYFIKLFKQSDTTSNDDSDNKRKISKTKQKDGYNSDDDEDDYEDEITISSDMEEILYDYDFNNVIPSVPVSKIFNISPNLPTSNINSFDVSFGLNNSFESYGFELKNPDEKDMELYNLASQKLSTDDMKYFKNPSNVKTLRKLDKCFLLDKLLTIPQGWNENIYNFDLKPISYESLKIYEDYIKKIEKDNFLYNF